MTQILGDCYIWRKYALYGDRLHVVCSVFTISLHVANLLNEIH